jgi:hypothetical protein
MAYLIRDYHRGKPVLKLASTKGKGKEKEKGGRREEKVLRKKDLVTELRYILNAVKDRVLEKAMDYAELLPLTPSSKEKGTCGSRLKKSPGVFVDKNKEEQKGKAVVGKEKGK